MILTIVLLWVLGVAILISVAVVRGRKKKAQTESSKPSGQDDSDRVFAAIRALQEQVGELDRKLSDRLLSDKPISSSAQTPPAAMQSLDESIRAQIASLASQYDPLVGGVVAGGMWHHGTRLGSVLDAAGNDEQHPSGSEREFVHFVCDDAISIGNIQTYRGPLAPLDLSRSTKN